MTSEKPTLVQKVPRPVPTDLNRFVKLFRQGELIKTHEHPNCVFVVRTGSVDMELQFPPPYGTHQVVTLEEDGCFNLGAIVGEQHLGFRARYCAHAPGTSVFMIPADLILGDARNPKTQAALRQGLIKSMTELVHLLKTAIASGSPPKNTKTEKANNALFESMQEELAIQIQENSTLKQLVGSLRQQMVRMDQEHAEWKTLRDNSLERYRLLAQEATRKATEAAYVAEEARSAMTTAKLRQVALEQFARCIQRGMEMVSCDNPNMYIRPAALQLLLGEEPTPPTKEEIEALSQRLLCDQIPPTTAMSAAESSWDLEATSSGQFEVVSETDLIPVADEPFQSTPAAHHGPPPLPKPAAAAPYDPRTTAVMVSMEPPPTSRRGIVVPPSTGYPYSGDGTASIGIPPEVRGIKPLTHDEHVTGDGDDDIFNNLRDSVNDAAIQDFVTPPKRK